jgi:DNA (cytosine-5)-methyltransferase 1
MPYAKVTVSDEHVLLHEAAAILNVSLDTIRRWAKKGLIKSQRSGQNHRLFSLAELNGIKTKLAGGDKGSKKPYSILKANKSEFNVIELFSGCGGMALGFENAGLKTEMLVEINKNAAKTMRQNRPGWNIVDDDIKKVSFSEYRNKIDVLAGGFPCQAFSYAGKGLGFGEPRGTLFFEFLRAVKEVRPKIALGENVRGLIKHDDGRTLKTMIHCLDESGYSTVFHLLRAQFLDVPQKRERLIIMGVRKDLKIGHLFPKEKNYTIPVGEALNNVPKSGGYTYSEKKYKIMKLIPPGGYWRDLPDDLQREFMGASYFHGGGKTGMARRLALDEPSLTLTCNPAQKQTERCHPTETRPLSVREYARIQTFPDEWEFVGPVSSQYQQIGNAVPVNLAYHIARGIIIMLKNETDENDYFKKTNDIEKESGVEQLQLSL